MTLRSVGSVPNPNIEETEIEDTDPIGAAADFLARDKWTIERTDDEVKALATRGGKDYCVCFTWYPTSELLHFGCAFEFEVSPERQDDIGKLILLINSRIYFGHLDHRQEHGLVVYRAAIPLIGAELVDPETCYFLQSGLNICASYMPAFQEVAAGAPVTEALERCLRVINTEGNA